MRKQQAIQSMIIIIIALFFVISCTAPAPVERPVIRTATHVVLPSPIVQISTSADEVNAKAFAYVGLSTTTQEQADRLTQLIARMDVAVRRMREHGTVANIRSARNAVRTARNFMVNGK